MKGRRLLGLAVQQISLFGEWFSSKHTLVFHEGSMLSFFFFLFFWQAASRVNKAKTEARAALR